MWDKLFLLIISASFATFGTGSFAAKPDFYPPSAALNQLVQGQPDVVVPLSSGSVPIFVAAQHPELQSWVDPMILEIFKTEPFHSFLIKSPSPMLRDAAFIGPFLGISPAATTRLLKGFAAPDYGTGDPESGVLLGMIAKKGWSVGISNESSISFESWTFSNLSTISAGTAIFFNHTRLDSPQMARDLTHELAILLDAKFNFATYARFHQLGLSAKEIETLSTPPVAHVFQVLRALSVEAKTFKSLQGTYELPEESSVLHFSELKGPDDCVKKAQEMLKILWDEKITALPSSRADQRRTLDEIAQTRKMRVTLGAKTKENLCLFLAHEEFGLGALPPNDGPRPRMGD